MSLVEIHGINKSYGSVQVLKDVTLDVAKGEIIAVIGRSGSGKSTMLRCINGLEPIQAGVIRVDGTQVHDPATNLRKLRQEVGIVFQSFNLFPHLSVCDNITLAPRVVKKQAPQAAREVAREVLKVLESVAKEGMTMILVTHEMGFARRFGSRVVFMHEGRIHEAGPAAETLGNPQTRELATFLSAVLH
jgi:polar amino acid transport system ATP-binding protein